MRCYAIEPNPHTANWLEHNARFNHFHNISIHRLLFSDNSGVVNFAVNKISGQSHVAGYEKDGDASTVQIRALTVDEFVSDLSFDRLDWIKIDVEGHEKEVLDGMRETDKRLNPVILLEGKYAKRKARVLLEEAGYSAVTQAGYNDRFILYPPA